MGHRSCVQGRRSPTQPWTKEPTGARSWSARALLAERSHSFRIQPKQHRARSGARHPSVAVARWDGRRCSRGAGDDRGRSSTERVTGPPVIGRIGADPRDDEELRQQKSLLVLLAVLILPVSLVWGTIYPAFGTPVGILPFVYFAVSVGSLALFARTRNFRLLLVIQLVAILLS